MLGAYGQVCFEIPRVPPSLSNQRLWWTRRYRLLSDWKQESWLRAQIARNERRLPHPHSTEPGRRVTIVMHRRRLLDTDNAYASVKGILDGLVGVLIYDDSPRYCDLVVRQAQVGRTSDEYCQITVAWGTPDA